MFLCARLAWSNDITYLLMVWATNKHSDLAKLAKGQEVKKEAQMMALFKEMAGLNIWELQGSINMWEKDSMSMDIKGSLTMETMELPVATEVETPWRPWRW